MKLVLKKIIQVSSDGSINFSYSIPKSFNKHKFYTKDNKNSLLLKKSSKSISSKNAINYKKKYF
jgi:hypothetical protein